MTRSFRATWRSMPVRPSWETEGLFSFRVVPRGQARIRTQMSAAHSPEHVDRAIAAFTEIGREMGLVG